VIRAGERRAAGSQRAKHQDVEAGAGQIRVLQPVAGPVQGDAGEEQRDGKMDDHRVEQGAELAYELRQHCVSLAVRCDQRPLPMIADQHVEAKASNRNTSGRIASETQPDPPREEARLLRLCYCVARVSLR
jgi:hypothetical protein